MPLRGEFSEVVPEAGEVGPLAGGVAVRAFGEHFAGEFCGEVGDFVEVAVLGFEVLAVFAILALALVFSRTEGGEEGFPGGWIRGVGGVGIEVHRRRLVDCCGRDDF